MAKKLLMIVNIRSGKSNPKMRGSLFEALCQFCDAGYLIDVKVTQYRFHAKELAMSGGYDRVVCCGGDGTLNETVCGLMEHPAPCPPLGYIPTGTTNDFAAALGLSKDIEQAAYVAVHGAPRSIDVGRFNDRYFLYIASFGAFTGTSYTVPQQMKNALGHTAYMLEALRQLPSLQHPVSLSITADGENLDGDYIFGSISNSTSIGGFMRLAPEEVCMDDGLYELLLVRNAKNPIELQTLITSLLTQNYAQEGIIYRHVSHVEIVTREEVPWTLDGEYEAGAHRVCIDNLRQALTVVT